MATSGDFRWPPAGRNDGHQWGISWPPVGRNRWPLTRATADTADPGALFQATPAGWLTTERDMRSRSAEPELVGSVALEIRRSRPGWGLARATAAFWF